MTRVCVVLLIALCVTGCAIGKSENHTDMTPYSAQAQQESPQQSPVKPEEVQQGSPQQSQVLPQQQAGVSPKDIPLSTQQSPDVSQTPAQPLTQGGGRGGEGVPSRGEDPQPAVQSGEATEERGAAESEGGQSPRNERSGQSGLVYTVDFAGDVPEEMLTALKDNSLLQRLLKNPPDDMTGLLVRITADEAEGVRVMHSYGYYEGHVLRQVNTEGSPVKITLTLVPGPQFTLADAPLYYVDAQGQPLALCPPGAQLRSARPVQEDGGTGSAASTKGGSRTASAELGAGADVKAADAANTRVGRASAPSLVPCTLREAGLNTGASAKAADVLDAVEKIPSLLAERGYPMARLVSARYTAHKGDKTLTAVVVLEPGPRARMGRVRMEGKSRVNALYVEGLRSWEVGHFWDQRQVDSYRDMLTALGLFRSVRVEYVPADAAGARRTGAGKDADNTATAVAHAQSSGDAQLTAHSAASPHAVAGGVGDAGAARSTGLSQRADTGAQGVSFAGEAEPPLYDVILHVADAPQRTVGGGLRYDTDRGIGAQVYWEDRNWLGNGERLRTELGAWQDTQLARVSLRKPMFYSRKQTLTAEAWARNEDTIAYSQRAVWGGAGIERILARYWTGTVGLSVESGDLKDPTSSRKPYNMVSVPVSLNFNNAGNPLDSTHGVRAQLQGRPTVGLYGEEFTAYPLRLDVCGFYPFGDFDGTRPRVVLAGRVAAGTLFREQVEKLPASLRWYAGGGGSVRGYAYQSLGPQKDGDPLGGASFVEVSGEARIAVWDAVSLVPFIDGGNVYPEQIPAVAEDGLQWGAGIGLRYQTPIGPLRLDVATPLNPRSDDGPVSFYLSIGQSF